jgi:acetyl-CoA hydrolase
LDLTRHLRPGDTVLVGQGTAEPRGLVEALIEQRHALAPLRVVVGASFTGLFRPEHADALQFIGFAAVGRTGELARAGVLDVVPVHLGSIPSLLATGRVPIDAVLLQLSAPDAHGVHSLGLGVDYLPAAIARARVVLAEVNPRVPFTRGDTAVRADQLTDVVHDERPLTTVERRPPLPEDRAIADHIAALIPDGATIQLGVGGTPDAVLAALGRKNDLGVHSGVISDAVAELIEAGVVTNRRKEIDVGVTVSGLLWGTDRLYRWAADNGALSMRAVTYTHDPHVLSSFESFYAINSATEVDLTGQINGEVADGRYMGTVGGQGAFARAGLQSAAGRSIVALPSTARDGTRSRIVAQLSTGVTTTPRADADVVVTEHGVADLRGATISERVARMIAIADHRHRDELRAAADIPGGLSDGPSAPPPANSCT